MYPKAGAQGSSAYHPSIAAPSAQHASGSATHAPMTAPAVMDEGNQPTDAADATNNDANIADADTPIEVHMPADHAGEDGAASTPPQASSTVVSNKCKLQAIIQQTTSRAYAYHGSGSQSRYSLTSEDTHHSKRSQLSLPDSLHPSRLNNTANAVLGMQGSISHLTKVIQSQMLVSQSFEDQQELQKDLAIQMLEELDDGLTLLEKTKMLMLFQKDPESTSTFVKLSDDPLRQSWLHMMLQLLEKHTEKAVENVALCVDEDLVL